MLGVRGVYASIANFITLCQDLITTGQNVEGNPAFASECECSLRVTQAGTSGEAWHSKSRKR